MKIIKSPKNIERECLKPLEKNICVECEKPMKELKNKFVCFKCGIEIEK